MLVVNATLGWRMAHGDIRTMVLLVWAARMVVVVNVTLEWKGSSVTLEIRRSRDATPPQLCSALVLSSNAPCMLYLGPCQLHSNLKEAVSGKQFSVVAFRQLSPRLPRSGEPLFVRDAPVAASVLRLVLKCYCSISLSRCLVDIGSNHHSLARFGEQAWKCCRPLAPTSTSSLLGQIDTSISPVFPPSKTLLPKCTRHSPHTTITPGSSDHHPGQTPPTICPETLRQSISARPLAEPHSSAPAFSPSQPCLLPFLLVVSILRVADCNVQFREREDGGLNREDIRRISTTRDHRSR